MGLRSPMCSRILADKCLMGIRWIFWCICNYYDLTMPIKVLLHLLPFGRYLNGGVLRSPILGFRGVLAGWDSHQSKAHPRLPNTCQHKVLLYLPPIGRNSNLANSSPIGGLGGPWGSTTVPIQISSPHSHSTYIHTICLSCTVWPQYTTRRTDRQRDRRMQ